MAAKVFFDPARVRVTVLLRCETTKISTTEILREAGVWHCVIFYVTDTIYRSRVLPAVSSRGGHQNSSERRKSSLPLRLRKFSLSTMYCMR